MMTQIRFRTRRTVIAAVLFVLGAAVYLTRSGAPPRVHLVTVLIELALAAVATCSFVQHRLRRGGGLAG